MILFLIPAGLAALIAAVLHWFGWHYFGAFFDLSMTSSLGLAILCRDEMKDD